MATSQERRALLSITCPWCGTGPGAECVAASVHRLPPGMKPRRVRPARVRSLDGGCHDARWQAALGRGAKVLTGGLQ